MVGSGEDRMYVMRVCSSRIFVQQPTLYWEPKWSSIPVVSCPLVTIHVRWWSLFGEQWALGFFIFLTMVFNRKPRCKSVSFQRNFYFYLVIVGWPLSVVCCTTFVFVCKIHRIRFGELEQRQCCCRCRRQRRGP